MHVTCPRCKRSLSTADPEGPPSFCMYCGQKLRDSPGPLDPRGMLTASLVPFSANPEEDDAEPPPAEVGGYRLLRFLGAGGMGTVFEAEAPESGRRVAVKLLSSRLASNPASVERFRQEGRLASQLSHPRCVFVLAADTDAGRPYIVMELMPGRTLKDLVDGTGGLDANDAVAHILDVIDGLAEAHRLGVLHRDVKPSNCFLTTDDRVKVGDFGLSKSLASTRDQHITQSGTFLGTVLFASPEQIRGEPLDYGSDVYSVCATLYFLLCGEAPYHHESATAALAKAISEPPPPICAKRPNVSAALERVVMKGLERDRDRRWQSLDDLREALVDLLPSRQTPARPRALVGAFLLDWLVLVLFVVLPLEVLHSLLGWPHVDVAGVFIDPVGWALGTAYFATLEGLIGRTAGKALLGLRVSRVGQTGPPGLERGWIRAATFVALWFWVFYSPAAAGHLGGGLLAAGALGIGLFGLAIQFRRTADGFRGVPDFLSGCHVTQRPLPTRRLRLLTRHAHPFDDANSAEGTEPLPATVGGYAVKGRLWAEATGEQVWLAEDRALGRRVLVWLMLDDGNPATPAECELPRPTRLRRLGRGTLQYAGRDLEWVAFAAPIGAPLIDAIRPTRPLPWADARFLLEHLVDELLAAEADGTLPDRLDLGQVWVEPNGRIQVLDFPMPARGHAAGWSNGPGRTFALLRQVASLTLEGRPRTSESGVHAPIPPHAAPMLAKLFANGYRSLAELHRDLLDTHAHSPEVTPAIRGAQLGIQAALLSFGLLLLYASSGLMAIVLANRAEAQAEHAEYALAALRDPAKRSELARLQGAAAAFENPYAMRRIEALRARKIAEAAERRQALLAPQRFLLDSFDRALDASGEKDELNLVAVRELLVWGAANEKMPAGKGASPWEPESGPVWFALIGVPLVWIVSAGALRGGLTMMLTGIAVVRTDGRRAYRRQCALRAAAVWLPVALLLIAATWLQIYQFRYVYLYVALWLVALALLPAYVAIALRNPSHPPQDRIAGTYLVPV